MTRFWIEFLNKYSGALIVERRLKTVWEERSCPNCGADSLHALNGSDRIWCDRCDWKTTYTRGTPFYDSELTPGEFLIAFILYADTLLSLTQIAGLLSPCYTTLHDQLREFETAFCRGFPTVWERISQPLGEVWTDGLPAYRGMERNHRYVVHDDEYVSNEGAHTNQVECLWSLLQPWLAKFRGLSKQGLEQAARTYGFLRSLNLSGAPVHGLVDCIAVNVFR